MTPFTRRELIRSSALGAAGLLASVNAPASEPPVKTMPSTRTEKEPFGYCFNTSTIRGQKLTLLQELDIAAKAGYQAIEPWFNEIENYTKAGGKLADLKTRIADLGLTVESAIAFPEWVVDDDAKRAKALEQVKQQMDILAQIGGKRLACPPSGATGVADMNLRKIAERYRAVLEIGDRMGVEAELEIWGHSKTLGRLSEAVAVAVECGHPKACILPDVYHLYKGGSEFGGIRLLNGNAIHVIHTNDYPDQPSRDKITDAERVYPGDGVAPLKTLFRNLRAIGFKGFLSLELFNRKYWEQDPLLVARTAIEKTRVAVMSAWEDGK